jgi:acylglycerol lipase
VTLLSDSAQKPSYREGFIKAIDGVELFYREWAPVNVEVTSVVLFIHGIGLHGGSPPYGEKILISKLLDQGKAFYSIDLRGHGRSGGHISQVMHYVLIRDLDSHVKHIKTGHKDASIVMYGHNFGGILSLYYASQFPENVRCVVVSEYSKMINENVKKIMHPNVLEAVRDVILGKFYHRSKKFEFLSPREYERLCARYHIPMDNSILFSLESSSDPGKPMLYGKEFFSACGVGLEEQIAKSVNMPVLMLFSRNDPFFDVRGAYQILTRLQSYDKELIQIDMADHYSIIESGRDIAGKWIMTRLPGTIK